MSKSNDDPRMPATQFALVSGGELSPKEVDEACREMGLKKNRAGYSFLEMMRACFRFLGKAKSEITQELAKVTSEDAAAAMERQDALLVLRAKAGEPITPTERKRLEEIQHGPSPERGEFVTNKAKLAELANISRPTLDAQLKKINAPKTRADGRYYLAVWLPWIKEQVPGKMGPKKANHTIESITEDDNLPTNEKKARIDLASATHDFEVKQGKYVLKSGVRDGILKANGRVRGELLNKFTMVLPHEYELASGKASDCAEINREALREVFKLLHTGEVK